MTFQGLDAVRGSFSINSTHDMPCDSFDQYYTNGLIAGDYNCTTRSSTSDASQLSRASTGDSAISSSSTDSAASSAGDGSGVPRDTESQVLSTGARIGIGIGVSGGIGALVGSLIGLLLYRRAKARKNKAAGEVVLEKDGSEVDRGYMLGNDVQKHELEHPISEMAIGGEAQELRAKHGMMELGRSTSTKGPAGIESRHEMPADRLSLLEEQERQGRPDT